uniref:Uncharacterized protein n=1 Tax=Daphnia galeata TaxID=27404 RepID=A0A8J2VZP2_9CRUS|nr:unnamed protein product [Daphnia galeata]
MSIYNIPEDTEIIGSTDQMKLKPGVVPHINLWFENADTSTSDISSIHTEQHFQAGCIDEADSGNNSKIYLTDNVPGEVELQHEDHSWVCAVNPLSLNDDNTTICEDVNVQSQQLGESDHNRSRKLKTSLFVKNTKVRTKKHQVSTTDLGISCGTTCSPLKWNITDVKSSTNSTAKRKAVFTFDTTSINSSVDTDSSYDFINDDSILSHTDQFGLSSEFKHKACYAAGKWISILSLISNQINVRKSSSLTPTDVIYLLFRKMRLIKRIVQYFGSWVILGL